MMKKREHSVLSAHEPGRVVYRMHVDNMRRMVERLETMWEATLRILERRYGAAAMQRGEERIGRMESLGVRRLDAKRVREELEGLGAYMGSMQANPEALMAEVSMPDHLDRAPYRGQWWVLAREGKCQRLIDARVYDRDSRLISTYVIEQEVEA